MTPEAPRVHKERLHPTDATLWDIEHKPTLRTTIVAVLRLDRPVAKKRLRNDLEAATRLLPRLRQRVVANPGGVGTPHWELDGDFELDRHLRFTPIEGDLDATITRVANTMASEGFDRDRPLWECVLITRRSGPTALLLKVHHSLTDGVGGVELLDVLFDAERDAGPRKLSETPLPVEVCETGSRVGDTLATARQLATVPLDLTLGGTRVALHPFETVAEVADGVRSAARLLAPTGGPRSALLSGRSTERAIRTNEFDLARMHDAAKRQGCTINHLFFAGVVSGVHAYHEAFDQTLEELRVVMPVSLRDDRDEAGGNRWAPVRFTVPADIADPIDRMRAMRALVQSSRQEPALGFSQALAGAVQQLPSALSSAVIGGMMEGVDVVLTNVPGLSEPRFLGGAEVERIFAFAPTAGAALNVALVSHGDVGCVGILNDVDAVVAIDEMADLIAEGLERVTRAAEEAKPSPSLRRPTKRLPSSGPRSPERLSALDTAFLRVETPDSPLHIGGIAILDGAALRDADGDLRLEDARRHIHARLRRVPRFVRKLSEVPFGLGRPLWVDDLDFDIRRHVRQVTVAAPGGRQQLYDLAAELHEEPLDRRHPLWEITLVDGLEHGEVAVIEKVHHALIDGLSGVELTAAIFDAEPVEKPDLPVRLPIRQGPGRVRRMADAAVEQAMDPIKSARDTARAFRKAPEELIGKLEAVGAVAREFVGPGSRRRRAVFNDDVTPDRELQAAFVPLSLAREVGAAVDATVNDVILGAFAGAMRRWMIATDQPLIDVHAFVPASLRHQAMDAEPGNRVGGVLLPLPIGEPDARRRLRLVRSRMRRLKSEREAAGVGVLLDAMDHLPAPVFGAAMRLFPMQPFANLVISNVPGPSLPLYFLGAELKAMVPILPVTEGLGLGVAALSYRGDLAISLFADPETCPDLELLREAIATEFDTLHDLTTK